MNPCKKYVLHPGPVISRTDGQKHYISAAKLANLYGISERDCLVQMYRAPQLVSVPKNAVHLYPRGDGNYALPELV